MIKRTTREHTISMIKKNKHWKVLDLGCGTDGFKSANVFADIENYCSHYPNNRFVCTEASETPFKDKEFDFVFCAHVAEHVSDPIKFFNELSRIGQRGYIETPTPFFDNLVEGNSNPPPHGHVWWVRYDDVNNEMIFKPRLQLVAEAAQPEDTTFLLPFFRESMITELYWENTIDFKMDESFYSYEAGNSDPIKTIDLRNKSVPKGIKKWRTRAW